MNIGEILPGTRVEDEAGRLLGFIECFGTDNSGRPTVLIKSVEQMEVRQYGDMRIVRPPKRWLFPLEQLKIIQDGKVKITDSASLIYRGGILNPIDEAGLNCFYHPLIAPVKICQRCGKLICIKCCKLHLGIYYCKDCSKEGAVAMLKIGSKTMSISTFPQTFGRGDFNGVIPDELLPTIARAQFTIDYDFRQGTFVIWDEGSINGTFVNGIDIRLIGKLPLRNGDIISPAKVFDIEFIIKDEDLVDEQRLMTGRRYFLMHEKIVVPGSGIFLEHSYNNTITSNNITIRGFNLYPIQLLGECEERNLVSENRISSYSPSFESCLLSSKIRFYKPRGQVHIVGDAAFLPENGVIAGNGTKENPFIIGGWNIRVKETTGGIWIENTSLHFVIKNCRIKNVTKERYPWGAGIFLENVANGTIVGNECNDSNYGIYLDSSTSIIIKRNVMSKNRYQGIYLREANNNVIEDNSILHNSEGIHLYSSNNNTVANNSILYDSYGIVLRGSDHNVVRNNKITRKI
ncbi:MAG: NosD domain-containing protein [Nitrososphaerota archaeon]